MKVFDVLVAKRTRDPIRNGTNILGLEGLNPRILGVVVHSNQDIQVPATFSRPQCSKVENNAVKGMIGDNGAQWIL